MGAAPLSHGTSSAAEALIRQRVQGWASAIGARDIEGVMALYSPDVVSFDLDPPLRYAGAGNKRRAWEKFFSIFSAAVSYEVSELSITTAEDTAFVHSLNHVQGQLTSGEMRDMWLRWTACFRCRDGTWRITHDHASIPVDVPQRRALLELEP